MRRALLLFPLLVLGSAYAQEIRPDVPPVLRKAFLSGKRTRYTGTRVVIFRKGAETSQHTEYVTRDGPRLRIEFPRESAFGGQIIVESKSERRHYFPDKNEIHVLPPRREEAFERIARLVRSPRDRFRFTNGPDEVVAGKSTEQVVVSDPAGNVVQRLYIEPNTGLVLKRQLFDQVGTRVGGFEFTEVDFRPRIRDDVFRLTRRGARIVTPAQLLEELARREGFRPVVLPATDSVKLEWSGVWPIDGEDVLTQSYAAKDGRLTLFQLKRIVSPDRLSKLARGRVKFVYWRRDGRTFVLVGNRSVEELRRLAEPVSGGTTVTGG
ncbi:MAG: sigma-E factor regulatory protein RseB domain-containing protein [Fimbriimonas sp.]